MTPHEEEVTREKNSASASARKKTRLDVLLFERGLAASRQRAQAMILAGQVLVSGQKVDKAGALVAADAEIALAGEASRYASRAGMKLEGALADFGVSPKGKVCLDAGSSTGGFTDCLLQQGAVRVYAVDVTTSQLDWKLQNDSRVVMVECNLRYLEPQDIPELVDLVTVDISFISATKVIGSLTAVAKPDADFLILIKPQFELERNLVGKGGIVRDRSLHERAIERVRQSAILAQLDPVAVHASRLAGAEGNQEFFLHARRIG